MWAHTTGTSRQVASGVTSSATAPLPTAAPPRLGLQDELLGLQEQQGAHGPAAQIDSDVLFRQGETLHGEGTYTPRLVLWDLSGALGGVSAGGSLYHDRHHSAAVVSTWAGRQEVHRAAPVPKSRFAAELENEAEGQEEEEAAAGGEAAAPSALHTAAQQLDSAGAGPGDAAAGGVRYFTDFLKAHLHPRSVQQLAGAWHGLTPFGGWGDGGEHWRSEEQREAMVERIRWVGTVVGRNGGGNSGGLSSQPRPHCQALPPPQVLCGGVRPPAGLPGPFRGPVGVGPAGGARGAGGKEGRGWGKGGLCALLACCSLIITTWLLPRQWAG